MASMLVPVIGNYLEESSTLFREGSISKAQCDSRSLWTHFFESNFSFIFKALVSLHGMENNFVLKTSFVVHYIFPGYYTWSFNLKNLHHIYLVQKRALKTTRSILVIHGLLNSSLSRIFFICLLQYYSKIFRSLDMLAKIL